MAEPVNPFSLFVGIDDSSQPIYENNSLDSMVEKIESLVDGTEMLSGSSIAITKTSDLGDINHYYEIGRPFSNDMRLLRDFYNYGISAPTLDTIFQNITQDFSPPKSSTTFVYDFKFSRNQNSRILTGSSGGGY
tara:strand:+ start:173 stop:574 length:402 start_codon:yes stop_codon:yes gene_type:complete